MTLEKLAQDNFRIILGRTIHDEIVELKIEFSRDYFAITHTSYDRYAMTSEQGEERAQEYLQDDKEMWKSAVENDNTELGFEDWNQTVLDSDGWQTVLGDIKEIQYNDEWRYLSWSSSGAGMDCLRNLEKTRLSPGEIEILQKGESTLHLKKLTEISQKPRLTKLLNQVIDIFKKYEIVDEDQEIGQYTQIGDQQIE